MRHWRMRDIGTRWQYGFFYAVIRRLGRRFAYVLADCVTFYYVLARPSVRRRCLPYLSRRFPGRKGLGRLKDTFLLIREFARILIDRSALGILGPGTLKTHFLGVQELKALLQEGHGLVLVIAHVGAWQLGMANLSALDCPVAILNHKEDAEADRHFYEHSSGSTEPPFAIIDPAGFLGGIPEMLQVLQQGGVLCIMGDRVMGSEASSLSVDFLGSSVRFPFSPYKLASATGAPVAVIFPFKPNSNQYEMRLAEVIRVPPDLGRNPAAYRPFVERFTRTLSDFTQEFPYHFFNFFDLWESGVDSGSPTLERPTKEPRHGHERNPQGSH